jgi:hypothetical protein
MFGRGASIFGRNCRRILGCDNFLFIPADAWEFRAVRIRVVIISDDFRYRKTVLREMSKLEYELFPLEFDWNQVRRDGLGVFLPEDHVEPPTIVMIDFGFLRQAFEKITDQVVALKARMAIECLALRPPADDKLYRRFTQLGVWMFDVASSAAMAEAVH